MAGVLAATVTGTISGIYNFTCYVNVTAVDVATAQTELNAIKAFFSSATNLVCQGVWTPQATSLTS